LFINLFGNPKSVSATASSTPENTVKNIFSKEIYTQESFVIDTVKATKGAVVSIVISKDVPVMEQYYSQVPGIDPNDPFAQLFGGGFNFQIPQLRQNGTKLQQVGAGSGFIVSPDGLIITNKHVVADKTAEYAVFLNDGKKYAAKVVARDPVNDLAVLKIGGVKLPYLKFANSDAIQVGQTAIAIGNALGQFNNTVSVGVVSGLARSVTAGNMSGMSEQLDNVIQTDAAINPGNSGGPLLNLDGRVIGVNVAVAQGSQNIGFSLPANLAKSVVDSVQKNAGKIIRPYLGIRYTAVTPELKDANHLMVDYGMLVLRGSSKDELAVAPGSPADKAGILENDIILEADGKKLTSDVSLSNLVRDHKVGDTMALKVLSKGTTKTVKIKLEAIPTLQ
jgi:S1-C subfamily serine protease